MPAYPLLLPEPCGFWRKSGGGGRIRTFEAFAADLQSAPFGHSGTPPAGGLSYHLIPRCQDAVFSAFSTESLPPCRRWLPLGTRRIVSKQHGECKPCPDRKSTRLNS